VNRQNGQDDRPREWINPFEEVDEDAPPPRDRYLSSRGRRVPGAAPPLSRLTAGEDED
jgi:hypothetical protein